MVPGKRILTTEEKTEELAGRTGKGFNYLVLMSGGLSLFL